MINMKHYLKLIISAGLLGVAMTSCLEETFPTDGATSGQLESADKSAFNAAIASYMNNMSLYGDGGDASDAGFSSFIIWRDAMTADFAIVNTGYDYFSYYNQQLYIGNDGISATFWQRYYYLIQKCNNLLSISDLDPDGFDALYVGNALSYRAMAYMDLARMFEFKRTGVAYLDEEAANRGIYGLTVPIVTENTTERESRDNPRAPFYKMYRFIMDDLNLAEACLSDAHAVSAKTDASIGVVYGLKARLWLDMGSRFERYVDDLNTMISHEADEDLNDYDKIGITTANECFARAAEYARKAINEGYSPLSESQWFDPSSGFNTPNNSWLWANIISTNDIAATTGEWQSFVSFQCVEANWGIAVYQDEINYAHGWMIDARLFDKIDEGDWRKTTWIDPEDAGASNAFITKYSRGTNLSYNEWRNYRSYVGIKYHPANGERNTSTIGNAVSIPLMRIEEMFLIEAEATAHTSGVGAGKQLLESFMNTYRMSAGESYICKAADMEAFTDELFKQKRVEFWGEGIVYWDYRRLELPIERGYPGSNHARQYRFNSYPEHVAPWTNFYIPDRERDLNKGVILNPDPSQAIPLWEGGN